MTNFAATDNTRTQTVGTPYAPFKAFVGDNLTYVDPVTNVETSVSIKDIVASADVLVGVPLPYLGITLPKNHLWCDGAQFNTTEYPELFAILGKDTVPDLRAMTIKGLDNGRGIDVGRVLGSEQGDAIRNIRGVYITHDYGGATGTGAFAVSNQANTVPSNTIPGVDGYNILEFDASKSVPTADENRVKNVAMNYIIKAKSGAIASSADFTSAVVAVNNALDRKLDKIHYSYDEQPTGIRWIDGRMIYEKTIDCGALPSSVAKYILHNIPNMDFAMRLSGIAVSGGISVPLPRAFEDPAQVDIYSTRTHVLITTFVGSFTDYMASVYISYVCTDR